jgi:hypothetical protein
MISFIKWCRNWLFGAPRRPRPEDQTVLAWQIPDGLLQRDRRS